MVADPTKDFNACDDFFQAVVVAHIIAAAMTVLKMKAVDDTPTPYTAIGAKPDEVWMLDNEQRKKVLDNVCNEVLKNFVDFSFFEDVSHRKDGVFSYAKKILGSGLFYLEYCDGIKKGDGSRITLRSRYLLPIFFGTGRTNYSCEILNMLLTLPPRLASQLLWSRL